MHGSGISIWFFNGVLLFVYGVLILSYGIVEAVTNVFPEHVELTQLHTPIWWGGFLLVVGALYLFKFWPSKQAK